MIPLGEEGTKKQAARCMDCGIPFCHTGCPVNNQIPDWNDLVYSGDWQGALQNLHTTNNFPEVTGRVCPAPCEASCTLNLIEQPVTIKTIEAAIADRGFEEGWVTPEQPATKTGKRVAVIGSGPAGMACAQQLARAGHDVHLYEKNAKAGGLLRYGIPDFKMEKHIIDRRVTQMEAEGVTFHYDVHVGVTHPRKALLDEHDAIVLTGGAEKGRDLPIEGRDLHGVHFAMDYLPQQNRRVSGEKQNGGEPIHADGKYVVVIGGGDTGSDCIGTAFRQGAVTVTQLEIMPTAAGEGGQAPDLAELAVEAPHLIQPGGRRGARVLCADDAVLRPRRPREAAALHARRRKLQAGPRHRVRAEGRPRAPRHGLRLAGARGDDQGARARARPARQRQGDDGRVPDLQPESVFGRRHAPRPVAGRLGDPRGPPGGARGRQVSDGNDDAAALIVQRVGTAALAHVACDAVAVHPA